MTAAGGVVLCKFRGPLGFYLIFHTMLRAYDKIRERIWPGEHTQQIEVID